VEAEAECGGQRVARWHLETQAGRSRCARAPHGSHGLYMACRASKLALLRSAEDSILHNRVGSCTK
jgi:hypothetical protein